MKIHAILLAGLASAALGYVGGKQFTDWYFADAATPSSPSAEPLSRSDVAPALAVPDLKPIPNGVPEAALPDGYAPDVAAVVPNLYLVPDLHPEAAPLELITSAAPQHLK